MLRPLIFGARGCLNLFVVQEASLLSDAVDGGLQYAAPLILITLYLLVENSPLWTLKDKELSNSAEVPKC